MKTVYELNKEEKYALKQAWLMRNNESVSYGELYDADKIVSDQTIYDDYGEYVFGEEDLI